MTKRNKNPVYIEKVLPHLDHAIGLTQALEGSLTPSVAGSMARRAVVVLASARAALAGEPRPRGPWPRGDVGPTCSDGRLTAGEHHQIAGELRDLLAAFHNHGIAGEALLVLQRLRLYLEADCRWHCGGGAADSAYADST